MQKSCLILLSVCLSVVVHAQRTEKELKGNVSYISSENTYVRFNTTNGIHVGDTLYTIVNAQIRPALVVCNLSSLSAMGKTISGIQLQINQELTAHRHSDEVPFEVAIEKSNEAVAVTDKAIHKSSSTSNTSEGTQIDGRLSVTSYSNFSSDALSTNTPNYRMRYTLALNAEHIQKGPLSFESYIAYTHKINDPTEKFTDLKIYDLAVRYQLSQNATMSLGRKINVNTANVGAVDGVQFDKILSKHWSTGAMIGFRPNDSTYSVDPHLFQYGAYLNYTTSNSKGNAQSSLAFFNQTNQFHTDRRYIYLQHNNQLLKHLDFFGSAEVDLYQLVNNQAQNTFNLTGLYLSLNYHPGRRFSSTLSYDARKNIYYYQTYKNRVDSLLESAMRQGMRFRFNYRPFRYFNWGGSAGLRLASPSAEKNITASSYISYSRIPWLNAGMRIDGTYLNLSTLSGFIYGGTLSKDFIDGNLGIELDYKLAPIYSQNITELGISWRISPTLYLSTDLETTFEQVHTTNRVFLNLTKRF